MTTNSYRGKVQNGVVVLSDAAALPDGVEVTVVPVAEARSTGIGEETTIWQKLIRLAEKAESEPCDLPDDLAINHDHYLYGAPKRQ